MDKTKAKKFISKHKKGLIILAVVLLITIPTVYYIIEYPDRFLLDAISGGETDGSKDDIYTNPNYGGYAFNPWVTMLYRDCFSEGIGVSYHVYSEKEYCSYGIEEEWTTGPTIDIRVYEEDIVPGSELEYVKSGTYTFGYGQYCDAFNFD